MDLVRREAGRGRGSKRGGVDFAPTRQRGDPGGAACGRAEFLHQRDLPVERGIDLVVEARGGTFVPVARKATRLGAGRDRGHDRTVRSGGRTQLGELPQRQVKQEIGRDDPACGFALLQRAVLVERSRERIDSRAISVGIRGGDDRVRAVEEIGDLEIGPRLLRQDIRPVGRAEPELRRPDGALRQRIEHDLAVELAVARQARDGHRLHRGDRLPRPRERFRAIRSGAVVEATFQRCVRTLVEPEAARLFGRFLDVLLEDRLERRVERGVARGGGGIGDTGRKRKRGSSAARAEKSTTFQRAVLSRDDLGGSYQRRADRQGRDDPHSTLTQCSIKPTCPRSYAKPVPAQPCSAPEAHRDHDHHFPRSRAVAADPQGARRGRLCHPDPDPGAVDPAAARGTRHARHGADRHRQDRRLRAPAAPPARRQPPPRPQGRHPHPSPRTDARARVADRRGVRELRSAFVAQGHHHLRRRQPVPSGRGARTPVSTSS